MVTEFFSDGEVAEQLNHGTEPPMRPVLRLQVAGGLRRCATQAYHIIRWECAVHKKRYILRANRVRRCWAIRRGRRGMVAIVPQCRVAAKDICVARIIPFRPRAARTNRRAIEITQVSARVDRRARRHDRKQNREESHGFGKLELEWNWISK